MNRRDFIKLASAATMTKTAEQPLSAFVESPNSKPRQAIASASKGTTNSGGARETSTLLDWLSFLERNDMVWPQLPTNWDNGAFLGNGDLGTIFWQDADGSIHFEVSRSSLYDHRGSGPGKDIGVLFREYRLPNGYFSLNFGPQKPTGKMRLDLWNAEARGQIVSDNETWNFRGFAPAQADLIVVELIGPEKEEPPHLTWHPEEAMSTRAPLPPCMSPIRLHKQSRSMG